MVCMLWCCYRLGVSSVVGLLLSVGSARLAYAPTSDVLGGFKKGPANSFVSMFASTAVWGCGASGTSSVVCTQAVG